MSQDGLIEQAAMVMWRADGKPMGAARRDWFRMMAAALGEAGMLMDPNEVPKACRYCMGVAVEDGLCRKHADALKAMGKGGAS